MFHPRKNDVVFAGCLNGASVMALSGSDFYRVFRPSPCDLRLYLHHKGVEAAKPGPFEEVIIRLGVRHENAHLSGLDEVTDVSEGPLEERRRRTLDAIEAGVPVIYQPVFAATLRLGDRDCDVVGIPDLLIRESSGHVIRDVKLSRRITEDDHPEIIWQLRLYGRLYEVVTGNAPVRLEVFSGKSEIVPIDPAAPGAVEEKLAQFLSVIENVDPPFEPVGWSKCA